MRLGGIRSTKLSRENVLGFQRGFDCPAAFSRRLWLAIKLPGRAVLLMRLSHHGTLLRRHGCRGDESFHVKTFELTCEAVGRMIRSDGEGGLTARRLRAKRAGVGQVAVAGITRLACGLARWLGVGPLSNNSPTTRCFLIWRVAGPLRHARLCNDPFRIRSTRIPFAPDDQMKGQFMKALQFPKPHEMELTELPRPVASGAVRRAG